MSQITGIIEFRPDDKHNWVNHGTPQGYPFYDRHTLWGCDRCPVSFVHYYNAETNIFTAMNQQNVPENCEGLKE